MKKFFMSAAILAAMFVSCEKNDNVDLSESLLAQAQKIEGVSGVNSWPVGHLISVIDLGVEKNYEVKEASSLLYKISGPRIEDKLSVFAFDPKENVRSFDNSSVNFEIPARQVARQDDVPAGSFPSYARYSDGQFNFNNLFGLLKLSFKGNVQFDSFRLSDADGNALTGTFRLNLDDYTYDVIDGSSEVEISTGCLLSDETVSYYVSLPEGEYSGLNVTMKGDGEEWTVSIDKPVEIQRNRVSDAGRTFAFYDAENRVMRLDENGRANCYMINLPGTYLFSALYKGNSDEYVRNAVSAELMWQDVPGFISSVSLQDDNVSFDVEGMSPANALIAVKDVAGNILWSWHIWYTGDDFPETNTYQNHGGARFEVMDRDLGNWNTTDMQTVYYQWGRKDPIPNHAIYDAEGTEIVWTKDVPDVLPSDFYGPISGDIYGHIETSVKYPMAFITMADRANITDDWLLSGDDNLWGDAGGKDRSESEYGWTGDKTMYDPCPYGYRVASKDTWTGFTTTGKNAAEIDEYNILGKFSRGWYFKRTPEDTEGDFYPANGVRFPSDGRTSPTKFLGVCWSSTPVSAKISVLYQYDVGVYPLWSEDGRSWGFSVRCVKETM